MRVKATPLPDGEPRLPKTIVWITTAVPSVWGMPWTLR